MHSAAHGRGHTYQPLPRSQIAITVLGILQRSLVISISGEVQLEELHGSMNVLATVFYLAGL